MGTISKPYDFSANTTISSSQVDSNFDTIYNEFNGNIAAANLANDSVTTTKIADSNVTTAKIADAAITSAKVATGMPVQVVNATYSAVATGSTVIPLDDTIPQNTEGTEFMSLSITPKSATNILVISIIFYCSSSLSVIDTTVALFQDSIASAIAVTGVTSAGVNYRTILPLTHTMTAGTTSSTTYKVRVGPSSAGTITMNGASGSRYYGAIPKSSIIITEYKA